jgi:UDP-glucose 4-epimerase
VDVVFNLATKCLPYSFVDPEETFMVNVRVANTLLKLLRDQYYQTLIHFSSSEAYGSAKTKDINENHILDPNTPYAAGKAAADLMIMSFLKIFNLDISIIRPFNIYGPRQNEGSYAAVIPITIKRILFGKSPVLEGDGNQTRDFTYVDDVTRAAVDVYKNKKTRGKIINIGSGVETKIKTIIYLIVKYLGYKGKVEKRPMRAGDVKRHRANIDLAKSLINFKPQINFNDGLRRTINWYADNLKL